MQKQLTEQQLQQIYNWVDQIPLSRPKRNMARDFSDAVLTAQIISHFYPNFVELHNFISTGSINQKLTNWNLLNQKVLKKLKITLKKQQIEALAGSQIQMIQRLLLIIRKVIQNGQIISPSVISKANTKLSFLSKPSQKSKILTWKQIQKKIQVKQLLINKDNQIDQLKKIAQLLVYKHSKLEQILKSKDKQIEQLVYKIKQKGII